ncbi:MAG TPA: hypothetical protein VFS62_13040, partial [Chloroflexota bacterium]|nr:hypothetical protein [Chloroflexota bacterium]
YPTSLWSASEQVQDVITLAGQGTYPPEDALIVGLYRLPDVRPILTLDGRTWARLQLPNAPAAGHVGGLGPNRGPES